VHDGGSGLQAEADTQVTGNTAEWVDEQYVLALPERQFKRRKQTGVCREASMGRAEGNRGPLPKCCIAVGIL
jgi:hypothetical protein